jgi:hypothetical protein
MYLLAISRTISALFFLLFFLLYQTTIVLLNGSVSGSDIQNPAVDLSPIVDFPSFDLMLFLFDLLLLFAVQLFCLGVASDVPFFCPSVIRYSAIPPFDNSPFG